MVQVPDRLYIDKSDRKLYDKVSDEVFGGQKEERKEQFLFAMAYGFENKIKRPLKKKEGFIRKEYLRDEDIALMNAVALSDSGSVEILDNKAKVFEIAEEYAHAGIKLIYAEVTSVEPGSFHKRFEKKLFDIYQKLAFKFNE